MGLKETGRALKHLIGDAPVFIEVVVGPAVREIIHLSDSIRVYPLGSMGNGSAVEYGARLLNAIGIPTDDAFSRRALQEGKPFWEVTAIIYFGLEGNRLEAAKAGNYDDAIRVRSLLGFYAGGLMRPIIRINKSRHGPSEAEFLAPPEKNGIPRIPGDPVSIRLLQECLTTHADDDKLHYWISLLEQSQQIGDVRLKIARLFSALEAMSSNVISSFSAQKKDHGSRMAVRTLLGYFTEIDIPRFTIEGVGDFEFDHIELAGRLRDKIFHGGGHLTIDDLPQILAPGLTVLNKKPEMIVHALRRDCELAITNWIHRKGLGWAASQGETIPLPKRDPHYDGSRLPKLLLSAGLEATSPIASIYVKIANGSVDSVRFAVKTEI